MVEGNGRRYTLFGDGEASRDRAFGDIMLVNEVLPGFNWGLYVQIFGRLPDVRDESSRVAWEQFYAEKVKARRLKQQIEAFLSETGGQD